MATINAVQNYTRMMAPVYSDLDQIPVFTFFLALFAGPNSQLIIEQDANAIDIDIQRGNKKLAAYIKRGLTAQNITKNQGLLEKYTSDTKAFPLIEEETPITTAMVDKRMPGEPVYQPFTKMFKQQALAMKAHREHMNRMIRKMEFSAAESIRTGFQTVDSGLQYDFYRLASHNASAATVWSTSATAVPLTDLAGAGDLIFRDGNRVATDAIFSGGSWDEFLLTTQVLNAADRRRLIHFTADMNVDAPAGYELWVNAGAVFQGQVKVGDWKLNMWTYPAIYETDAAVQTQYLPDGEVIVLAKGARMDRYFGPSDVLEFDTDLINRMFGISGFDSGMSPNVVESGIFQSDMFHADAWGGNNNKSFVVRSQVAPIFPTIEIDTIVKLTT